ncbi:serine protease [Streptomyces sp. NPDC014894]|uniref:S1 family peptidase n=1 Tax=Streptomyces sp. NPDC014894 TaxID=3364931 RepID=UPI0036FF5A3E
MAVSRREQFTVRICRTTGDNPAGVGFLLGSRHIVTCAHVVNAALGRPLRSQDRPSADDRVTVRFPLLESFHERPLSARVVSWSPPLTDGLVGGDVAGLLLEDAPPEGAERGRLFRGELREQSVELYGFPGNPPRRENGAWASGTLRGRVGRGALQIDKSTESALRAQPGFSGGPVTVAGGPGQGDRIAGMIVVAGKDDGTNDAYAVGISHLSECRPQEFSLSSHPEASAAASAFFADRVRRILYTSADDCELLLPEEIRGHRRYDEYLTTLGLHSLDGLLGIWGRAGLLTKRSVTAFSPTELIMRNGGTKRLRQLPYEDLPDYEIYKYMTTTRRGVHLDQGIRFEGDHHAFRSQDNFTAGGAGLSQSTRQPMVRVLSKLSALVLGDPEPTGEGPPARCGTAYIGGGFHVRSSRW